VWVFGSRAVELVEKLIIRPVGTHHGNSPVNLENSHQLSTDAADIADTEGGRGGVVLVLVDSTSFLEVGMGRCSVVVVMFAVEWVGVVYRLSKKTSYSIVVGVKEKCFV